MAATVTVREHVIEKTNSVGLVVKKSLNQDFVFVNDKLAGYLTYPDKKFKPLSGIGWDNEHNQMICDALQKIKGADFGAITALDAIDVQAPSDEDE